MSVVKINGLFFFSSASFSPLLSMGCIDGFLVVGAKTRHDNHFRARGVRCCAVEREREWSVGLELARSLGQSFVRASQCFGKVPRGPRGRAC